MARNRPGHRFWFGRYTSATPVPGLPTNDNKRAELRRRLRVMEREWGQAMASAATRGDARILNYFQDPAGSEMWSRWDMQDHPPDILITNYSMLNIMLMRGVEEGVFDLTRAWLQENPANLFHLVVDELHSYRGTPGTEVGYLLRALLDRIGLTPDSPQLRIIATSASIEDDSDSRLYLEQFFGRDPDSFKVISGRQQRFPAGARGLAREAARFARAGAVLQADVEAAARELTPAPNGWPAATLASALTEMGALEAVRKAGELRTIHRRATGPACLRRERGRGPRRSQGPRALPGRRQNRRGRTAPATGALLLPQCRAALGMHEPRLRGQVRPHTGGGGPAAGRPAIHRTSAVLWLVPGRRA